MAFLFYIDDFIVVPHAETLLVSPFKEIWQRDDSGGKVFAMEDFTWIEFMTSELKSNPYRDYNLEERKVLLRRDVITRDDFIEDDLILRGIDRVLELQSEGSLSYRYLRSAKDSIEKLINFFDVVDLNERNVKTGMPIWKPKDITSALNDAQKTLSTLVSLQGKVDSELGDVVRTRGGKEISPFAQ